MKNYKDTTTLVHQCEKCGKKMINAESSKEIHKKYCNKKK